MKQDVRYTAAEGFVTREIAGEVLVVPVGEQTRTLNGLVTFSEAGAFLWKRLAAQGGTQVELTELLAAEYGKQPDEVRADVEQFLNEALSRGLIVAM